MQERFRLFRPLLLSLILLSLFTAVTAANGSDNKPAHPPRVAISQFTVDGSGTELKGIAASLSDLLMVRLADKTGIELIDRSMTNRMIAEISINMSWLSDASKQALAGRMLGSDFTVTGSLHDVEKLPVADITVTETRSGIIRNFATFPVATGKTDSFLSQACGMILKTAATRYTDSPYRRFISIGGFINQGNAQDDDIGYTLSEYMFKQYMDRKDIGVISRTHLGLLLQEIDLEKFKYVDRKSPGLIRKIKIAGIQIDANFRKTPESIMVNLIICIPGEVYLVIPIEADTLEALTNRLDAAMDDALEADKRPVSAENVKKGDDYRQKGMSITHLAYTEDRHITPLMYQLNMHQTASMNLWSKKSLAPAISNFKKALEYNPYDYKTMIPLALCYLSESMDMESTANRLLQRVMIGSTDPELKVIAKRALIDTRVTKGALTDIPVNKDDLYTELINGNYIDGPPGCYLYGKVPANKSDMQLSTRFEPYRDQIYAVLIQAILNQDYRLSVPVPRSTIERESNTKIAFDDNRPRWEAAAHCNRGKSLCRFSYNIGPPPSMNTDHAGGDLPENDRITNLNNAISEFESALLIQPDYYEAMLFLACCLKDKRINDSKRAERLFLTIAQESKNDTLRFIAGDLIDIALDMQFNRAFMIDLYSGHYDYFGEKYKKRINLLSILYEDGRLKNPSRLSMALIKGMKANCNKDRQGRDKNVSSTLTKTFYNYAQPLVKTTMLAEQSTLFSGTRSEILKLLWKEYPTIAPHVIAAAYLQTYDRAPLIKAFYKVRAGEIEPDEPDFFFRQLMLCCSKAMTQPVIGEDVHDLRKYIEEKLRHSNAADRVFWISYLYKYGNLDSGLNYAEKWFPLKLKYHYSDKQFVSADFDRIENGDEVLKTLKRLGYLDAGGRLTEKFKGLTPEFSSDLKQLPPNEIEHIGIRLKKAIGIMISPIGVNAAVQEGEGFYLSTGTDEREWGKVLRKVEESVSARVKESTIHTLDKTDSIEKLFLVGPHCTILVFSNKNKSNPYRILSNINTRFSGRLFNLPTQRFNVVYDLVSVGNRIWLGTDKGFLSYSFNTLDARLFTEKDGLPPGGARHVCTSGNLIYATFQQGLGMITDGKFNLIDGKAAISGIAPGDGGVWTFSKTSGLILYKEDKSVRTIKGPSGLRDVTCMASDSHYVAAGIIGQSGKQGIFILDIGSGTTSISPVPDVCAMDFIDGHLWIGGKGFLAVMAPGSGKFIFSSTGKDRRVYDFLACNNDILIAADNKITCITKSSIYPERQQAVKKGQRAKLKDAYKVEGFLPGIYRKTKTDYDKPVYRNQAEGGYLFYWNNKNKFAGTWVLSDTRPDTRRKRFTSQSYGCWLSGAPADCTPDYPLIWSYVRGGRQNPYLHVSPWTETEEKGTDLKKELLNDNREKAKRDTSKKSTKRTNEKLISETDGTRIETATIYMTDISEEDVLDTRFKDVKFTRSAVRPMTVLASANDRVVVGAPDKNLAYILDQANGKTSYAGRIIAPRTEKIYRHPNFSRAVALSEKYLVVGAPLDDLFSSPSRAELAGLRFIDPVDTDALLDLFYKKGYVDKYNKLSGKFLKTDAVLRNNADNPGSIPAYMLNDFKLLKPKDLITAWRALREGIFRSKAGKVYVYSFTNGRYERMAIILPDFSRNEMKFGNAVAVSGENIAVATYDDKRAGPLLSLAPSVQNSVYFYRNEGKKWIPDGHITIPGTCNSLDMEGMFAIAGSSSSALIFRHTNDGWEQDADLRVEDACAQSGENMQDYEHKFFGQAVAISGRYAFIGSHESVYVYRHVPEGWQFHARITAGFFISGNEFFGNSLAASDKYLVIGAKRGATVFHINGEPEKSISKSCGKTYIFIENNGQWRLKSIIVPEYVRSNEEFGVSIGISDMDIIIASHRSVYFIKKTSIH